MEYIYAALLLHKLGKPVNEEHMTNVLKATGVEINESKVKSLIASLQGVDIDAEIANAVVASATAPATSKASESKQTEEAPKEEKKEAAAEGLSALFG